MNNKAKRAEYRMRKQTPAQLEEIAQATAKTTTAPELGQMIAVGWYQRGLSPTQEWREDWDATLLVYARALEIIGENFKSQRAARR